jgi:hypothetical protein
MPYRALLATLVTVALALLAVGMWAAVVGPMISAAQTHDAAAATAPGVPPRPAVSTLQLHALTRAVLILSFVLILMLLVVGLASTIRAWMRTKRPGRRRVRTRYVDAWKLSAERLDVKKEEGDEPPEEKPDPGLQ